MIRCSDEPPTEVQLQDIRLHSPEIYSLDALKSGTRVLMNYNVDYPKERGYWYDVLIKEIKSKRGGGYDVIGDVSVGRDNAVLHNCHLMFFEDIYKIKPYQLLIDRTVEEDCIIKTRPFMMSNE